MKVMCAPIAFMQRCFKQKIGHKRCTRVAFGLLFGGKGQIAHMAIEFEARLSLSHI
jgi:hypothetical protein